MSTDNDRERHAKRMQRAERAISRQSKIAKQHHFDSDTLKQSHRFNKHHAMDCGNPGCGLCGNPRHIQKDSLTVQEKRFYQEIDNIRDMHSNGIPSNQEDKE